MAAAQSTDDFLERIRTRLGDRYEITRELFGGGMSRVFVAREIALDRTVVIKFLPPEIAAEANRDRFRREIQVAAKLSHPHIAPLFASAEEGELLYFTMPFIAGESLRHSLDTGRRFSVGETLEILVDVADALAYAHRAGIVHRDIKPANILREGGHAVITDFGVAKALSFALGHGSGPRTATTSGLAFGTPAYMAPEQIAGDSGADHRVDIYAFGLLGYELLTGQAPFRSSSPQAVLAAQLTQAPAPILQTRPDVPPVLAALLARCLEKDASRRPPSAESVLEVLRAVTAVSGGSQLPATVTSATRRTWIAAGVATVLAALVLWFVIAQRNNEAPVVAVAPAVPVVDSALLKAQAAAAKAESALAAIRANDSARRASERSSRQDQRITSLLRDSIANALRVAMADSIARAKELELVAQRQADSLARARRAMTFPGGINVPTSTVKPLLTPDAFLERRNNPGPPRRIGVAVYSGLRNPPVVIGAAVIRDSIMARLRARAPRFIIIPGDSITQALARSREMDSLRTWMRADMWVTINASGDVGADSLRWSLTLRDFTAHSTYQQMSASSPRVSMSAADQPPTVITLVESVMRLLDTMDKAPRK